MSRLVLNSQSSNVPEFSPWLYLALACVSLNVVGVQLFVTHWTTACQAPHPLLFPRVCSDSCPLSEWCHPTISSLIVLFLSCSQSVPASGSFLISQHFTSSGQSIGALASASVLPVNIRSLNDPPDLSPASLPFVFLWNRSMTSQL